MPKRTPAVTDAELAVMKVLWETSPLPARAIAGHIYSRCTESEVGTVHSLLQRLERKGLVSRDRTLHVHLFSAAVSREDVAGEALETLAVRIADGSMAPFILPLVKSQRLSPEEATEIRRMLRRYRAD